MPDIYQTNAQIAAQIHELLTKWNAREAEFRDWLGGVVGGGPNLDGKYPLSDSAGRVQYAPALSVLVSAVEGPAVLSQAAMELSEEARDAALSHQGAAGVHADRSETAREVAIVKRNEAEMFRNDAAASSANAGTYRTAAEAAKVASEEARDVANERANDATVSAEVSTAQAAGAASSAERAASSEQSASTDASTAASKAEAASASEVSAAADAATAFLSAQTATDAEVGAVTAKGIAVAKAVEATTAQQAASAAAITAVGARDASTGARDDTLVARADALLARDAAEGYAASINPAILATKAELASELAALIGSVPSTLDTLQEFAEALGNDPNFATTLTTALAGKASLVHGHAIADIVGLQTALEGKQAVGSYVTTGGFTWTSLADKPVTFEPTAHSHPYLPIAGGVLTGLTRFKSGNGNIVAGTAVSTLEAFNETAVGGAHMSFHRAGSYAIYLGLDTDNAIRLGGWSSPIRMSIDTAGNATFAGNITANSDRRLKSNIRTLNNSLALVRSLRGTCYTKDGIAQIGVIAQEVQEVFPEVVVEANDDLKTLSVAYGNLVAVLIEAVKELADKVEGLE